MLAAVFSAALGPSRGPDIELFQRFRKLWPCIDQSDFRVPGPEIFDGISDIQRTEMLSFYTEALKSKAVREDYHELLQLCYIFLGGSLDGNLKFRAPGALHRARWMAKAIYSLKIFLFKGQMKMSAREQNGMSKISVFVAVLYTRFWHEAPRAEHAPFNDYKMLDLLHQYPVPAIRTAAIEAFSRHLWYFSEHLITLALFDDHVCDETKTAMVYNFSRPPNPKMCRRLDKKTFIHSTPLEEYVTSRSLKLFDLFDIDGQAKAQTFLAKPVTLWSQDNTFQAMKENVTLLKVVNDCAERGVALIQSYNNSLTKNEDQKQYLLQLVSRHRKLFPVPTKAALTYSQQ